MRYFGSLFGALVLLAVHVPAFGGVLTYGDEDCLGTGCYGANDPTAGVTLQGLSAGTVQTGTPFFHTFPFSPGAGDLAGTDQIYVGSVQTGTRDGYSGASERINGPAVITLDYSSLIPIGQTLQTLTLGIAADDFQNPAFGDPFTGSINGSADPALTGELNALSLTGPNVEFFTIGLNPTLDNASHILTLSIDEGGDGGDGYAVDFLTVGVTTSAGTATPEPSTMALLGIALVSLSLYGRRVRRTQNN